MWKVIPIVYCTFTALIYLLGIAKRARDQDGAGAVISAVLAGVALLSTWIVL